MHLPWNHSTDVLELLDDDRVTPNSIRDRTKRNLAAAREIEALAREKGIKVVEPFAGARNNNGIVVLGPTKEFYQRMLAGFKFMPGVETNEAPMILAHSANPVPSPCGLIVISLVRISAYPLFDVVLQQKKSK